jgi:hypothetical protein
VSVPFLKHKRSTFAGDHNYQYSLMRLVLDSSRPLPFACTVDGNEREKDDMSHIGIARRVGRGPDNEVTRTNVFRVALSAGRSTRNQ